MHVVTFWLHFPAATSNSAYGRTYARRRRGCMNAARLLDSWVGAILQLSRLSTTCWVPGNSTGGQRASVDAAGKHVATLHAT